MPLSIVTGDITHFRADAVVNAANETLLDGGGGVDHAIHLAAGPALQEECRALGRCKAGQAKATKAYALSAKYIVHAVGPVWQGGGFGEWETLRNCYANSLALARELQCDSIAFPLLSSGTNGCPRDRALAVATDTIRAFLNEWDEMQVTVVLPDREHCAIDARLNRAILGRLHRLQDIECNVSQCLACPCEMSLSERLSKLDESFQQMLLRKIDEKGLTDAQCYKKANIDRKLFSKIRSNVHYKPTKKTAAAFAVALELNVEDTEALLRKAGFALSDSSVFDVILRWFIEQGEYDIDTINRALYEYDQVLLGA